MHGSDCSFTTGQKTRNNNLLAIDHLSDFSFVVGWNATHVVVDGWHHGSRLFGDIDIGEDFSCFGDTWQSFMKDFRVKMV